MPAQNAVYGGNDKSLIGIGAASEGIVVSEPPFTVIIAAIPTLAHQMPHFISRQNTARYASS